MTKTKNSVFAVHAYLTICIQCALLNHRKSFILWVVLVAIVRASTLIPWRITSTRFLRIKIINKIIKDINQR